MRDKLRADLKVALKARDRGATTALRSALAAIDNAEAVPAAQRDDGDAAEHVAGATLGVGTAEADRRELTEAEVRSIIQNEVTERTVAAEEYEQLGRDDLAEQLRSAAEVLSRHLPPIS